MPTETRKQLTSVAEVSSPYDNANQVERLNRRLLEADSTPRTAPRGGKTNRVAILSLLFNWPSTGGGIIHTAELAEFLNQQGHEVCHFYAVHDAWGVGRVEGELSYPTHALVFDESTWNQTTVRGAFTKAVDEFQPDIVIVTDSWNSKVVLAESVSHYPYFLRLAALECLCPLNNVRLIPGPSGEPIQCHKNQLATPSACASCVRENQQSSGGLHAAEREFSGFDKPEYRTRLARCFKGAAGVLAVNPLIAAACAPYSDLVEVIPSGFDQKRFIDLPEAASEGPFRFLFAGLTSEYMKGFHVLLHAASLLWNQRQDFEVVVTAAEDDVSAGYPFLSHVGWQTQRTLPQMMAECHAVVVPTIAQEALGRTAVEAMGAARPVIASRIGGLPYTVADGFTGLLVEPAVPQQLADCMGSLIDNREFAAALGRNGRTKFERELTWDVILKQKYGPLFQRIRGQA